MKKKIDKQKRAKTKSVRNSEKSFYFDDCPICRKLKEDGVKMQWFPDESKYETGNKKH